MRRFCLPSFLFLWVVLAASLSSASSFDVVYSETQSGAIMRTSLGGGKAVQLATEAFNPEISPDGTKVAFTDCREGGRRIAIVDVATRTVARVPGIPGDNSYAPRWSPDGTRLLFNHWLDKEARWVIGLISPEGNDLFLLPTENQDVYSPFWAADGQSIYAQDLKTLTHYALDGKVLDTMPLTNLGPEAGASSATHFSVSPDGKRWLYDAMSDVQDDAFARSFPEPLSAIYVYDTETGGVVRVSPPGYYAGSGSCWTSEGDVLFSGFTKKDVHGKGESLAITFRLFLIAPGSGEVTAIGKDALDPSCAMR